MEVFLKLISPVLSLDQSPLTRASVESWVTYWGFWHTMCVLPHWIGHPLKEELHVVTTVSMAIMTSCIAVIHKYLLNE